MEYLQEQYTQIFAQIYTHLGISLSALCIAICIGVPCGYLASKSLNRETYVTTPFQILRVVPSLAILVLLIPIIGTGIKPAIAALVILAIPPILLNTIVGFKDVSEFYIETARGMGLDPKQELWKVRIPLALPMILAGIRTALVEVIASATLAAKIGAGGLGEIIFTGLGLYRTDLLIIGGVLVALLSLISGWLFDALTRYALRYQNS